MSKELNKNEQALLRTVAYWLRGEMIAHLKDVSPSPELLHDLAQSNYEISCGALGRVGMFTSEGHYWRVRKPEQDRPALVGPFLRSDLDHLLDAFACHSDYVIDFYQYHEPIKPTQDTLRNVCLALAECGYMEATSDNSFEWTDKFGPWLVRHGAWSLDDFEAVPQEEVDEALATIPEKVKEWLSGSSEPHFVRCFFAQWINGKWEEEEWRYAPSDDWDLNLAASLYARLQSR